MRVDSDSDSGTPDDLLGYLARWLRDYEGPPEVVIGLESGGDPAECRLAWLTGDGPSASGNLTVWETGDVAIELYDSATADAVLLSRGRVSGWPELAPFIASFVATCAGTPRSGAGRSAPSTILDAGPTATDPLRRRMRH